MKLEIKTHKEYYNNDIIISMYEYYMLSGYIQRYHGVYRAWYDNGVLRTDGYYQHNKLHGKQCYYNRDGFLTIIRNYRHNESFGFQQYFYHGARRTHHEFKLI